MNIEIGTDENTSIAQIIKIIRDFRQDRGWLESDNVKHLAMAMTKEAAELQEIFTWCDSREAFEHGRNNLEHLGEEIADVLVYLLSIADIYDFDISYILADKLTKNALRYPALPNTTVNHSSEPDQ